MKGLVLLIAIFFSTLTFAKASSDNPLKLKLYINQNKESFSLAPSMTFIKPENESSLSANEWRFQLYIPHKNADSVLFKKTKSPSVYQFNYSNDSSLQLLPFFDPKEENGRRRNLLNNQPQPVSLFTLLKFKFG